MQWQHTVVWACQVRGHESAVYDSPGELEHHIRSKHPASFTATQLPIIGMGGVSDEASLRRMLDVGATMIGVGTAAWFDHGVIARLRSALVAIHETGHD